MIMTETKKYIDVLNRGYEGFAPMAIGKDFAKSLQQAQEALELLKSLNYDTLLVEATSEGGKAYLNKYQSTGAGFEYGLHFMKDRKKLLGMLQPDYWVLGDPELVRNPDRMFRFYIDRAERLRADGVWNDEQWREYRWTLSEIEKGLEVRLRQFAAYGFSLDGDDTNPQTTLEPQEKDLHYYCQKAIEKGYLVKADGGYRRATWSKAQLAYFLKHFLNTDGTFPDKKYCEMFGESRLSKAAEQLINNKNGGGKPRGYEQIDKLLQE